MGDASVVDQIVGELRQKYGCHTVILYGSRARGDAAGESDYDVAGFRPESARVIDARMIGESYLDAFIYHDSEAMAHPEEYLHLREGRVLVERAGFGKQLLEAIGARFSQGPAPLTADEIQHRRVWVRKMLGRIQADDLEAHYRRAWLQTDLLQNYFALRRMWYLGSKESFQWLAQNDRVGYSLFELALKPGATNASLKRLAEHVLAAE